MFKSIVRKALTLQSNPIRWIQTALQLSWEMGANDSIHCALVRFELGQELYQSGCCGLWNRLLRSVAYVSCCIIFAGWPTVLRLIILSRLVSMLLRTGSRYSTNPATLRTPDVTECKWYPPHNSHKFLRCVRMTPILVAVFIQFSWNWRRCGCFNGRRFHKNRTTTDITMSRGGKRTDITMSCGGKRYFLFVMSGVTDVT